MENYFFSNLEMYPTLPQTLGFSTPILSNSRHPFSGSRALSVVTAKNPLGRSNASVLDHLGHSIMAPSPRSKGRTGFVSQTVNYAKGRSVSERDRMAECCEEFGSS